MTAERAREIAAQRGWTLRTFDGLVHVLAAGLPIGVAPTVSAAVDDALSRHPL